MKTLIMIIACFALIFCKTSIKDESQNDTSLSTVISSLDHPQLSKGEHYAIINGVKLWYTVRGNGPILLIYPAGAGWGGDASIHYKTLQPLEKKMKIIYLEPRGIGHSERVESVNAYSMDNYVKELEAFRKYLNIEPFDLSGHCYGGCICLKYAIKHPEKVNHLILLNTTPYAQYGDYQTWEKNRKGYDIMLSKLDSIRQLNIDPDIRIKENMRAWAPITFYDYDIISEGFNNYLDQMTFSASPVMYFNKYDRLAFNVVDSLAFIDAKTLIILGDDDLPFIKIGSKVLYEKIPESKLITIQECGHWPFLEQPMQLFKHINSFLSIE
ncbi:MAG: hypothetical protein AMS26_06820 [Bacteroides sp. SM23_62]|nr:MAG: hypothetical protein AMS26_06820 [Bacteroides sp. SM23_62]